MWFTADPGAEEALIAGIQDVLGPAVPIAGGSSADNDVGGAWMQLTADQVLRGSVLVSVLYPSRPLHVAFHSGYSPGAPRAASSTRSTVAPPRRSTTSGPAA